EPLTAAVTTAGTATPSLSRDLADRSRKLRVGYVSADFKFHPGGLFLTPILASHRRDQVEPILFADVEHPDDYTRRMAQLAAASHSIVGQTDAQVAELVRA